MRALVPIVAGRCALWALPRAGGTGASRRHSVTSPSLTSCATAHASEKAVVLLSGGVESTTLLHRVHREAASAGGGVVALFSDYGQRGGEQERAASCATCLQLGVELVDLKCPQVHRKRHLLDAHARTHARTHTHTHTHTHTRTHTHTHTHTRRCSSPKPSATAACTSSSRAKTCRTNSTRYPYTNNDIEVRECIKISAFTYTRMHSHLNKLRHIYAHAHATHTNPRACTSTHARAHTPIGLSFRHRAGSKRCGSIMERVHAEMLTRPSSQYPLFKTWGKPEFMALSALIFLPTCLLRNLSWLSYFSVNTSLLLPLLVFVRWV